MTDKLHARVLITNLDPDNWLLATINDDEPRELDCDMCYAPTLNQGDVLTLKSENGFEDISFKIESIIDLNHDNLRYKGFDDQDIVVCEGAIDRENKGVNSDQFDLFDSNLHWFKLWIQQ